MTFQELYNKYLQILKTEDKDDIESKLDDFYPEIREFVETKYPELTDFIDYCDLIDIIDYNKNERNFIERIIRSRTDDNIIYFLTEININKIIKEYIDKHI